MKYNGVIQRKLALLDDQVQKLKYHTKDIPFSDFEKDWVIRSMTERALQVCSEIMIDIAERIIAIKNAGPAAGAAEAIDKLNLLGVISSAEPYRSMVRLRNLIVHEYEQIDPEILYSIITTRLDDFLMFRDELDRGENRPGSASCPCPVSWTIRHSIPEPRQGWCRRNNTLTVYLPVPSDCKFHKSALSLFHFQLICY